MKLIQVLFVLGCCTLIGFSKVIPEPVQRPNVAQPVPECSFRNTLSLKCQPIANCDTKCSGQNDCYFPYCDSNHICACLEVTCVSDQVCAFYNTNCSGTFTCQNFQCICEQPTEETQAHNFWKQLEDLGQKHLLVGASKPDISQRDIGNNIGSNEELGRSTTDISQKADLEKSSGNILDKEVTKLEKTQTEEEDLQGLSSDNKNSATVVDLSEKDVDNIQKRVPEKIMK